MFGKRDKKQICGFILVTDRKIEDNSDFREKCISELKKKIKNSEINSISDMNVLKDDFVINKHKSKERYRVYIPIEYISERGPVSNRKEFRDKISSINNISIIFNKKSSVR